MTAIQMRLHKHYWGIGATMVTFLVGAWLVVSFYALGNQRYSTPWSSTTTNDCWVGIGVMFVSLVGLMLFTSSLLGTLRAAGFLRPSPRLQAALAPGLGYAPPASPYRDEYERTMAILTVALATDLSERRARENGGKANDERATGRLTAGGTHEPAYLPWDVYPPADAHRRLLDQHRAVCHVDTAGRVRLEHRDGYDIVAGGILVGVSLVGICSLLTFALRDLVSSGPGTQAQRGV